MKFQGKWMVIQRTLLLFVLSLHVGLCAVSQPPRKHYEGPNIERVKGVMRASQRRQHRARLIRFSPENRFQLPFHVQINRVNRSVGLDAREMSIIIFGKINHPVCFSFPPPQHNHEKLENSFSSDICNAVDGGEQQSKQ